MITKIKQDAEVEFYNNNRAIILSDERIILNKKEVQFEELLSLLPYLSRVKVFEIKNINSSSVLNKLLSRVKEKEVRVINNTQPYWENQYLRHYHFLAINPNGETYASGKNTHGELGSGENYPVCVNELTKVKGMIADKNIIAVATGRKHSLALDSRGAVYAWGCNEDGQLGDGTNSDRFLPIQVGGIISEKEIIAISAGLNHSLALDVDGKIYAWGCNTFGQLGYQEKETTTRNLPQRVSERLEGRNIVAISAGSSHSLALDSEGIVYGWGVNNFGQIGDETINGKDLPVKVKRKEWLHKKNITSISAGTYHSLALDSEGVVYGWGNNHYGQLNDGTTINCLAPIRANISSIEKDIIAISAGKESFTVIDIDGNCYTWGGNK